MNSEEIRDIVVEALEDLKGTEIKVLDVHEKTSVTDILVIASGTSNRQVKSLASNVQEMVKKSGITPLSTEGSLDSGWTLIDLGDVVVHVMLPETRDFYNLEKLWGDDVHGGTNVAEARDGDSDDTSTEGTETESSKSTR